MNGIGALVLYSARSSIARFWHELPAWPDVGSIGAAALFGCAPAEVIMVACRPSDLAVVARYGLPTCYVSRKLEYGEGRIVEPAPKPGTFDLMVDGVDDLADLLLR
jgi:hypothetical protein